MGDIIYIYVLVFAILCCFLPRQVQKQSSIVLLMIMMLICGFRAYDVGVDTHNYAEYAAKQEDVSDYNFGPFYLLLKYLANLFPNSQTAFLLIMAMLTYIPLAVIARKYSEYPALSVLMYIIPVAEYFVQSFNICKQSIAIVYVLIAAILISKGKKKPAFWILIFCLLIHPYSFFGFILFFIDKIKLSKAKVTSIIAITMTLGLVGTLAGIQDILNLIMLATSGNSSYLIRKLGKYGDYEIAANFSLVGQLSHMLPLAAMCYLGANEQTMKSILYKMMLAGCAATNIFVSVIFCERIASTYTIAQFLIVPYILKTSSRPVKRLIVLLLFGTTLLFLYNLRAESHLDMWTPYHTIFD